MRFIGFSYLVFLLFLVSISAHADVRKLDSLLTVLRQHDEDTNKINTLLVLADENSKIAKYSEGIGFALEAMILSERLKYEKGKIKTVIAIGKIYFKEGKYADAEEYLDRALHLTKKKNNTKEIIKIHELLAKIYRAEGNYKKAVQFILNNYEIQEKEKDEKGKIGSLLEIGAINREEGFYTKAIESYDKAFALAKTNKDIEQQAFTLVEKGRCYREKGDMETALTTLDQAYQLMKERAVSFQLGYALDEMGKVYAEKKNFEKALEYFFKSSEISSSLNLKPSLGYTYLNISSAYFEMNDFDKAKKYCEKSIEVRREIKDNKGLTKSLNKMGDIFLKQGDIEKAMEKKHEALEIAEETGAKVLLLDTYQGLAIVHSQAKKYKEALVYYQLYTTLKDSLADIDNVRKVAEMQSKYEEIKHNKEIGNLKKEQKQQEIETRRQKYLLFSAAFVLLIVSALTYFMFKQMNEKKKANLLLETTNKELEKLSIVARETDNAILITDAKGIFDWANEAFARLSGYTLQEFISVYGKSLLEASTAQYITDAINRCMNEKTSVDYEYIATKKSGEKYWVHATVTPILDNEKNIQKMVVIETDITEKKLTQLKIQERNQKIAESINYARSIQKSLIPSKEDRRMLLKDSFVFYLPKDIVSGDFPWFLKKGDDLYFAAIDCTGHGVPGAMISFVGYFLLTEINSHRENYSPARILDLLHKRLVHTLKQDSPNSPNARDGMDIALCKINQVTRTVQFAGAHRPLLLYKKKAHEIEQISGDKLAIGGKLHDIVAKRKKITGEENTEVNYTNFEYSYQDGDAVFFGSDGFQDQFGGEKKTKYGWAQMKDLVFQNIDLPMEEIGKKCKESYLDWKGAEKQIDDVLFIGIRL